MFRHADVVCLCLVCIPLALNATSCITCSLLLLVDDERGDHMEVPYGSSKKTQPARGWNAAEICTNCVYTIPVPRGGGPIPIFGQAGRRSLQPGWLCSSQKRGTSSYILVQPHTQTNTLQSFGFVTSVTKK